MSDTSLKAMTIHGSCDKVLNLEKAKEMEKNLPAEHVDELIEGGCHAYFGMYGEQDGDGTPSITNEEQIAITVNLIKNFI